MTVTLGACQSFASSTSSLLLCSPSLPVCSALLQFRRATSSALLMVFSMPCPYGCTLRLRCACLCSLYTPEPVTRPMPGISFLLPSVYTGTTSFVGRLQTLAVYVDPPALTATYLPGPCRSANHFSHRVLITKHGRRIGCDNGLSVSDWLLPGKLQHEVACISPTRRVEHALEVSYNCATKKRRLFWRTPRSDHC